MKKNKLKTKEIFNQKGLTLLELIVVVGVIGFLMIIVTQGITKTRQVLLTSNAAKEMVTLMKEARRNAINNVVTSNNAPPYAYYFQIDPGTGDYRWGECDNTGTGGTLNCSSKSVKAAQYGRSQVSACGSYRVIKFNRVTGEFVFTDPSNLGKTTPASSSCKIKIEMQGSLMTTRKFIEVNADDRTIKIVNN